ncbi:DNA-3-methyladenine glycosylase [Micractinium conductrix]|uniref:DNA-3-methyladenine glycosylase n=1 Tax=Micractinium conductrix TaxID=554055 RepID=A0A2P6VKN3_9CHLO|nr:DNA-3-methyladenine glycosylase [Micractinium conductrix]|eukprot:PSC74638.1 DNA-3-methyladenine glycosylase [Micractinium conductrix]
MVLSQNISISLSIIALCGLVGAGVAVGSGVGMMSMAVLEAEKQQQASVAHTPLEKVVVSRGFAASGAQQHRRLETPCGPAAPRSKRWRIKAAPLAIEEWDIVEFSTSTGDVALGRVAQVAAGEVRVERLEEDAAVVDHSGDPLWVLHGAEEETVPLSAVRRTLQADYCQVVDPDRVSNPHGEHALEAHRLLEPFAAAAAAAAAADSGGTAPDEATG